jgi:erythromycin esterase
MGHHLRQELGDSYRTLGMTFHQGGFLAAGGGALVPYRVEPNEEATLDQALAATGLPALFLDLRKVPAAGKVGAWFGAPQGAWFIGLAFQPSALQEHVFAAPVLDQFDGLLFVETTTPCRPWNEGG